MSPWIKTRKGRSHRHNVGTYWVTRHGKNKPILFANCGIGDGENNNRSSDRLQ